MLLKEVYNQEFLELLTSAIVKFDKKFAAQNFLKSLQKDWKEKSLKQRMRAISLALEKNLSPKNYQEKIEVLKQAVVEISKDKNSSLALIIFPDFVEIFGLKDFEISMNALEFFTEFGSSEFAVRQFIKSDEKAALKFFAKWTKSKNFHVRRLASEGCRPRLPWGEALPNFKKDPTKILPILEALKNDSKKYVQKSVANNLNDISKDNPAIVLELLKRWRDEGVLDFIIKHALRTLLKKGDKAALKLVGIFDEKAVQILHFDLSHQEIEISQSFDFQFTLENHKADSKIRLEYAVYFLKKSGSFSKKIFQITTKNLGKGVFKFSKKHSFCDLSTRKHNAGQHLISLVVNGIELGKKEFYLTTKKS